MIQKLEPRHFGPDSGFGGATFSDVIDKVNEIIDAMNGEHDPADIYSEDGRLIAKKDESEDERMIRKIEMFLSAYGADYFSNDEWREIEDWLEKHKEQKPDTFNEPYNPDDYEVVMEGNATSLKRKKQKPISSCDIVPYIDEKIAALQDMWREEKVSFDWDDMKDMIEDVARHFYHKEQKPSTGIYWHAIKRGDKIPCRAYLYKVAYETENNFGGRATIDGLLVPNIENVTCGCDTWYLPADDVKNLPREGLAELQKENPKSADSIPADFVSDAKCEDRWHKTANSLPDNGRDVLAKDALGNYLIASFDGAQWFVSVYDGQDHPVLHTPPILEWSEIPSEKQKEPTTEELYAEAGTTEKEYIANTMKMVRAMRERKKEQKPISQEDFDTAKHEALWDEQKPAWSEEDTDMLNCCISSIEEAKENRYAYKETDGDTSYDREIDWLKSLRPSWKPSEEQMDALIRCIAPLEHKYFCILSDLYEQLKKL